MNDQANALNVDNSEVTEISHNTYWVGRREGSLLERNIYLRIFEGSGKKYSLLIDPGPPDDLIHLTSKLSSILGSSKKLNMMFLNHQDPDVCYNAGYIQKLNPRCLVLCSEDTWRLVRFYGLSKDRYRPIEKYRNLRIALATGHRISFIPSPFCHFRGATMLYDHETRILFTGDLLGGLSYKPDLIADKSFWDGVKTFHQIYMPSKDALRLSIQKIKSLDPAPIMIAPQHGGIIPQELTEYFLNKLEELPVGLNLLLNSHENQNYIAALNEFILEIMPIVGEDKLKEALNVFSEDGSFSNTISMRNMNVYEIKTDPESAMKQMVRHLLSISESNSEVIEMAILKVLLSRNIPFPDRFFEIAAPPEAPDLFQDDM